MSLLDKLKKFENQEEKKDSSLESAIEGSKEILTSKENIPQEIEKTPDTIKNQKTKRDELETLDIDEISVLYFITTKKKRKHDSKHTKAFMVNKIIKKLQESK